MSADLDLTSLLIKYSAFVTKKMGVRWDRASTIYSLQADKGVTTGLSPLRTAGTGIHWHIFIIPLFAVRQAVKICCSFIPADESRKQL
jgi:hypothetical protein